jgi:hypothetical protein
MCSEITGLLSGNESAHEVISDYVNILSSDEIYFALEGIPIQELIEVINQTPMSEELCCGFHYAQCVLKCFLLIYLLAEICGNNKLQEINIIDDSTGS